MGHDDVRPGRVALFGLDGSRRPGFDHGAARRVIDAAEADVLILGAGGAGLCAALHAADRSPNLSVTVVVKGLLGRAGCTRMVQGGYNAVLTAPDRKSTRLNSSHGYISYAVFCLKKKKQQKHQPQDSHDYHS